MPAQDGGGSVDRLLEELVALERSALDRWIKLDPQGYLDLRAPEVTYFDPFTERRVDGLDAMRVRAAGADEENEAAVHGSKVRDDRSPGSAPWRGGAPDIQPCQLWKTAGCSGTCPGSLEFHRGLRLDWRDVEDHPQPLVIHTAGS